VKPDKPRSEYLRERNVAGPVDRADSELLTLGRNFQALREALVRTPENAEASNGAELMRHCVAVQSVHRQLFALATASLVLPAKTLEELRVKAELLLEYADPDANDIVGSLTQDLCRNVLALAVQTMGMGL
jgi:hypothetical protein